MSINPGALMHNINTTRRIRFRFKMLFCRVDGADVSGIRVSFSAVGSGEGWAVGLGDTSWAADPDVGGRSFALSLSAEAEAGWRAGE